MASVLLKTALDIVFLYKWKKYLTRETSGSPI